MIRIASNGHLRTQIPQLMQVSSLIAAFVVSGSIQMTSVPVRCGGQKTMHSRWRRLGWHRSLNTTATRTTNLMNPELFKNMTERADAQNLYPSRDHPLHEKRWSR